MGPQGGDPWLSLANHNLRGPKAVKFPNSPTPDSNSTSEYCELRCAKNVLKEYLI